MILFFRCFLASETSGYVTKSTIITRIGTLEEHTLQAKWGAMTLVRLNVYASGVIGYRSSVIKYLTLVVPSRSLRMLQYLEGSHSFFRALAGTCLRHRFVCGTQFLIHHPNLS